MGTVANMLYGIYKENLVHVDQVDNGLDCNCTCPSCGEKLVARNRGKIKEHHFAHYFGADCDKGYETSLHLLAKNILAKEKRILLPKHEILGFTIVEEKLYQCSDVLLEKRMSSIIPDVYIKTADDERILIEIKVTHGIDEEKTKKIEQFDISTLEIDLSKVDQSIDEDLLTKLLIQESVLKTWIYHKSGSAFYRKVYEKAKIKQIIIRRFAWQVDYCPINMRDFKGKSYANVTDDCYGCRYLIEAYDDPKFATEDHSPNAIRCFGHLKIDKYTDIDHLKEDTDSVVKNVQTVNEKKQASHFSLRSLVQLWYDNKEKPFRAVNRNGIQVQINRNPYPQLMNTGQLEAEMYKSNGESLGVRIVFGAKDFDWKYKN